MKRHGFFLAAALAFLAPTLSLAQTDLRRIPVITQVQGAVFFRTSVTLGNDNSTKSIAITLLFSYRSPVDGSFQTKGIALTAPLGPHHAVFFEDIVQTFKDSGVLPAGDAAAALFGTLMVKTTGADTDDDVSVVARTYSPATGGGTNGIAYQGRIPDESGSNKIHAVIRNGSFGHDGTTRANIGFINEGTAPVDVQVIYFNADTGTLIKSFKVSDIVHHPLSPEEVFQTNNVFADATVAASGANKIVVEAIPLTSGGNISGYVAQLDGTTNDGSFFVFSEYGH